MNKFDLPEFILGTVRQVFVILLSQQFIWGKFLYKKTDDQTLQFYLPNH